MHEEYCRVCGVQTEQRYLPQKNKIPWYGCDACKNVWGHLGSFVFVYDALSGVSYMVPDHPRIVPAVSVGEVVEVHNFLESFDKPLTELFARK